MSLTITRLQRRVCGFLCSFFAYFIPASSMKNHRLLRDMKRSAKIRIYHSSSCEITVNRNEHKSRSSAPEMHFYRVK